VVIHTYMSLYSGAGGLDVAYKRCNPNAIPLVYVERDFEAATLLVDKMETGSLDKAPVWSNTNTLDSKPFVGKVDAIIGGFPCQPFSIAGRREGTEDERWLWEDIKRLVGEIRPRELFLENVPGLFRGGIQLVVGELSTLGYDARWITLRANEVGSPHRRERVFILAHSRHDARSTKLLGKREGETIVTGRGSTMADTSDNSVCDKVERNVVTEGSGRELEDTNGERLEGEVIEVTSDVTRSGRRPYEFPPGLTDPRWEDVIRERPDLAPSIPTKPTVRAVAHGMGRGLARSTKLKLLGNGVVPKQAAVAYGILKGL
jgi:DNA (cytosine-5)-methyltransferase 1